MNNDRADDLDYLRTKFTYIVLPGILETFKIREAAAAELADATDRAVALIGAATLEEMLRRLIRTKCIEGCDEDALFTNQGPCSTFSSKITLAFALGLISPDERRDLDLLRKIRNTCAHSLEAISLDSDDRLKSWCLSLRMCERTYIPLVIPDCDGASDPDRPLSELNLPFLDLSPSASKAPRQRLEATIIALTLALGFRFELHWPKTSTPEEIRRPQEIYEAALEAAEWAIDRRDHNIHVYLDLKRRLEYTVELINQAQSS